MVRHVPHRIRSRNCRGGNTCMGRNTDNLPKGRSPCGPRGANPKSTTPIACTQTKSFFLATVVCLLGTFPTHAASTSARARARAPTVAAASTSCALRLTLELADPGHDDGARNPAIRAIAHLHDTSLDGRAQAAQQVGALVIQAVLIDPIVDGRATTFLLLSTTSPPTAARVIAAAVPVPVPTPVATPTPRARIITTAATHCCSI
mmetsp:Transcript_67796/g.176099  ORF Transcript_67796/g.176099 Transcript_67796/m.176099 type:complete len:205 (+) Transcript_67796:2-616(+)